MSSPSTDGAFERPRSFPQDRLAELNIVPSMGRTGGCWDNSIAESFFSTLKNELVTEQFFQQRKHARGSIVEYTIGSVHSGLDYRMSSAYLSGATAT